MEKVQIKPKILLIISSIIAVVCALMIPRVNVNSDMTRYLPDDSRMKHGMDILAEEFGQSSSSAVPDVRVMVASGNTEAMKALEQEMSKIEGVDGVKVTAGQGHTLFELTVAKTVHQKRLAREIEESIPYETVTQTSQDGNTPAPKALVFAVICLLVILLIMSSSFLEPVLFLAATGMAVAVNMGTNALLNSVSITTHSIAAVLQLALSMDYSIILMNRYRHQLEESADKYSAMAAALKKAAPAILSSALTTVVGLTMLAFMRLKIGKDLGFVLAKGVVCSLIYTYTALPGLILLCHDGIMATGKKIPIRGTGRLSSFCQRFRVPITALSVILFAGSYYISSRTPIKFSSSTPTAIDKVFTRKNAVVVLYENDKESEVTAILDKVADDPRVESIFSYPSLMKKKLGADEMVSFLKEQAAQTGNESAEMLTPELMRICYYAKFGDKDLKLGFMELVDFVKSQSDSPLLANVEIPDLDEKFEMLEAIRQMSGATVVAAEPQVERIHGPRADVTEEAEAGLPDKMPVHEYMLSLDAQQNTTLTKELVRLTDPSKLKTKMTVEQMTAFMGSTPTQTKMVYSFSKNSGSGMTPVEFAHFLVDDLFNRKALAKMVKPDQKAGMTLRMNLMDAALSGAEASRQKLDAMVLEYGVKEPLKDTVAAVSADGPKPAVEAAPATSNVPAGSVDPQHPAAMDNAPALLEEQPAVEEDPRVALLEKMLKPGRKYDAARMSRNFRALGENVDEFTVSMLYTLYGSRNDYNPEWKMDLEEFTGFVKDFLSDERMAPYLGEDIQAQMDEMESGLKEGVTRLKGTDHSIAAIITDYPDESPETERFIKSLDGDHYLIGESPMIYEMKDGFHREQRVVTLLTILAIFSIVAITFRSLLIALILVMTVMTAVFINVCSCGIGGDSMFYLAYLIVQSILMGATIDYGILMTTYFREHHSLAEAYHGSIRTILTSGLIMCCVPGAMAIVLDDAMIEPIVRNLAVGSFAALVIALLILPGVLSLVIGKKK